MNNVMARAEKAIEDFDAGLIAHLDLDDAVKSIIQRAEAAEARAAQLEQELKNAGDAYAAKAYTVTELSRVFDELADERDELRAKNALLIRERDAALAQCDRANAGFAEIKRAYDTAMSRLSKYEKVTA